MIVSLLASFQRCLYFDVCVFGKNLVLGHVLLLRVLLKESQAAVAAAHKGDHSAAGHRDFDGHSLAVNLQHGRSRTKLALFRGAVAAVHPL